MANNFVPFNSVEENKLDLLAAMQCLKKSPQVLMIDPFENKVSKDSISYNFIDVQRKVIIDSLNMLNNTSKCFLQVVNFPDKVFIIQREHT